MLKYLPEMASLCAMSILLLAIWRLVNREVYGKQLLIAAQVMMVLNQVLWVARATSSSLPTLILLNLLAMALTLKWKPIQRLPGVIICSECEQMFTSDLPIGKVTVLPCGHAPEGFVLEGSIIKPRDKETQEQPGPLADIPTKEMIITLNQEANRKLIREYLELRDQHPSEFNVERDLYEHEWAEGKFSQFIHYFDFSDWRDGRPLIEPMLLDLMQRLPSDSFYLVRVTVDQTVEERGMREDFSQFEIERGNSLMWKILEA